MNEDDRPKKPRRLVIGNREHVSTAQRRKTSDPAPSVTIAGDGDVEVKELPSAPQRSKSDPHIEKLRVKSQSEEILERSKYDKKSKLKEISEDTSGPDLQYAISLPTITQNR
jgi:hypothetical protein